MQFFCPSAPKILAWSSFLLLAGTAGGSELSLPERVSYHEHVRPLFQAKCQGCHQPAKAKGNFVMTEVARMIEGGDTSPAVVPGQPGDSYLLELVTVQHGQERAEMPPKDDPLSEGELALVRRWIEQGAEDDTPDNARQRYDQDRPPLYSEPPVLTSLDYSPDGTLLAISGFHEVLLHRADGSGLEARLVGLSERIESARFSPDGTRLAVSGGLPGRMGEIQIWNIEKRELELSRPVGYDTAYGVSWSPDGTRVAFGLSDRSVRVIDAQGGQQSLFMGGHDDWVLDTAWSMGGEYLISVGRDMTAKLTEVATERLVDNITSITPGILKGGLNAVSSHPAADHILVGGADGVPQIYRIHRETARKIGDNANLIRRYPAMDGRIWGVDFAPDGKRFVAVSSLDGAGQVQLFASDYDATISPELKRAFETPNRQADGENDIVTEFQTRGAERLAGIELDAAVFSVAWSPDGQTVAAGTDDGRVLLIDVDGWAVKGSFIPVAIEGGVDLTRVSQEGGTRPVDLRRGRHAEGGDPLPAGTSVESLEIHPAEIELRGRAGSQQVLVTGLLQGGGKVDLTRSVDWLVDGANLEVDALGRARAMGAGTGTLTAKFGGHEARADVRVVGWGEPFSPDFLLDVNPIIARLGCNTGTCHGANDGKNGFKLSLRGYDPVFDVRAFVDDHAARRVNSASPDDSLMLLKATGAVPHEGGALTEMGSLYYDTIRQWIADGAELRRDVARVVGIEIFPKEPVIENVGGRQQMRVEAIYADGGRRDVTREAYIESVNGEVAVHDDFGLLTSQRRGEASIVARYEGAYAATPLTVMGDRDGFEWEQPEEWGEIDRLVAHKWQRLKIQPAPLVGDEGFVRRVHLDLTGLPPSVDRLNAFLADGRPSREKRDELVDELIGSPEFVVHWTNKWADLLQVNGKFLGQEGATLFRAWIREQVAANTPYDEFVWKILTASGSNKENPAASYFKILRNPEELVENTTHLFLATRFNCNKCHDHPFEKWNVDDYYQTAAFFGDLRLGRDGENAPKQNIGGSAVEGAVPLYEIIDDGGSQEVIHPLTGQAAETAFPFPAEAGEVPFADPAAPTKRERLAAWITSPDNPYFAKSYANRVWAYLMGTGLIEPIDDIRAGNPPSNPELLDYLTERFVTGGYDARLLMAEICKSRTYQLSIESNKWNADDEINYSKAKPRRLPAEVLFDTVYAVTGATPNIAGAKPGQRAAELVDGQADAKGGFLATLGRPTRESACECDRQNDFQLGSVMALLGGPAIAEAVGDPGNEIARLVTEVEDDRQLIGQIYLQVLNRSARPEEIDTVLANWAGFEEDNQALLAELERAEAEWLPQREKLERARNQAIQAAEADIEAYRPEAEKLRREAEAARASRIEEAEKALEVALGGVDARLAEWEARLQVKDFWTRWDVLSPLEVTSSDKSEVEILEDGSVRAAPGVRKLDFRVRGEIGLRRITGVMVESIPDEASPGFGAGLNPNGNFVVSEVEAELLPTEGEGTKVRFSDAVADFDQEGFSVKNAINGNAGPDVKGWALSGSNLQMPHRANFQLEQAIQGDGPGASLVIGVLCRYSNGDYPLGRFRIWVTSDERPLQPGLPRGVADAAILAPEARDEGQQASLREWVGWIDPEIWGARSRLALESKPLPGDAKMAALESALREAGRAIEDDPRLLRVRGDVAKSIEQAANRRLTLAQDLTWALINNAAFLFNH